ncbi:hypothetical protein [Streptomyces sp. NPDC102264]|uniref:hypothetical protein n=1 Tax=Streptomyces sp. NPDC102264 TaxID=3366149 RepID=UPI00381F93F0
MSKTKKWDLLRSPRGMVLEVLGLVTLGVAMLSVVVSFGILEPRFGRWAAPTVGALDALWVIFQATEILAGNNSKRAQRVRWAGLALTVVNAAIPTVHLILTTTGDGFDLAMVLTPVAIVATKGAWWLTLPSLGRKVSDKTRETIAAQRQAVADQLEEMEAQAAHRVELLAVAADLKRRVAEAETAYRLSVLETQQATNEELHAQALDTAKTVVDKPLPASVTDIALPVLKALDSVTPALLGSLGSGTAALTPGTQVSVLPKGTGPDSGTPGVPVSGTPARELERAITLAEVAFVAGVPVPEAGERLTDEQLDVALRHMRYLDDPPLSYRKAMALFRTAGFVGSEERVRKAWIALTAKEDGRAVRTGKSPSEEAGESEDEPEDADA